MVSGRIPDLNNKYDFLHSYHGVHWGWGALAVAASPRGTGFVPEAGWWSWVVLNRSTLWDAACCSGGKPSCLTSWFGRPIPLAAGEGTIWAAAGVVDVTPANKAKRSVSWVSSEGATTGWASTCGESCTQAADGDEGEYYSAADEGLPRQGSLVSRCWGKGLSSWHPGRSSMAAKGTWPPEDATSDFECAETHLKMLWSLDTECRKMQVGARCHNTFNPILIPCCKRIARD